MSTTNHYRAAVEALFRARPNQDISCYELASVGGMNGWRTRVSELRKRGMAITDRPKVQTLPSGAKVTYYRWVPAEAGQVAACGSEAA